MPRDLSLGDRAELRLNNGMVVTGHRPPPHNIYEPDRWGSYVEFAYRDETARRSGGLMEVRLPGTGPNGGLGSADVVARDAIYEVKRWGAYLAIDQLLRYSVQLPELKLCAVVSWNPERCMHVAEPELERCAESYIAVRMLDAFTLERFDLEPCADPDSRYSPEFRERRRVELEAHLAANRAAIEAYDAWRAANLALVAARDSYETRVDAWWRANPWLPSHVNRYGVREPVARTEAEARALSTFPQRDVT